MIDVVVPVFNRPDYTEACLGALALETHGTTVRTVVVDNGSRKRTKDIIGSHVERLPGSRVITLDSNTGFSGAVNAYLSSGMYNDASHVVIMHNDVIPFRGWAAEMLGTYEALEAGDDLGVLMPRTCYSNEMSVCHENARNAFVPLKPKTKDRLLVEEVADVVLRTYEPLGGVESFLGEVAKADPRWSYCPEIASFCFMTKPKWFSEFGRFDEDFGFRGYEDKLWFLGLERSGLCAYVANRAYVHHFGNMTSDGPGFCMPDLMSANEKLYKEKVDKFNRGRQ